MTTAIIILLSISLVCSVVTAVFNYKTLKLMKGK